MRSCAVLIRGLLYEVGGRSMGADHSATASRFATSATPCLILVETSRDEVRDLGGRRRRTIMLKLQLEAYVWATPLRRLLFSTVNGDK